MSDREVALTQAAVKNYKNIQETVNSGSLYRFIAPYHNNRASWMVVGQDKKQAVLYAYNLHGLLAEINLYKG